MSDPCREAFEKWWCTGNNSDDRWMNDTMVIWREAWNARAEQSLWIPVTERLPEEGTVVLVYVPSHLYKETGTIHFITWGKEEESVINSGVTHWITLPSQAK